VTIMQHLWCWECPMLDSHTTPMGYAPPTTPLCFA